MMSQFSFSLLFIHQRYTMPRILSRNASLFKRRGSHAAAFSGARMSSVSSASSQQRSNNPLSQWLALVGVEDSSPRTSNVSTGSNTPSVSSRTSASSHRSFTSLMSASAATAALDEVDGWGQFVDTAEAEEEFIRSSKILSKRYSMQ
jgi:hypothetical protein